VKTFKPMLASSMDADEGQTIDTLTYPLLASPKIDGIRCLIIDGVAMSRTMKPIPNRFIQSVIGNNPEFNGLDGELLVGATFQAATSGIMSEDGEPDFTYYAFDVWDRQENYSWRMINMILRFEAEHPRIKLLNPLRMETSTELRAYLVQQLGLGHEGVMVRSPDGPYKNGRATWKEGYLIKLKPFEDAEATVIGFEEAMHNGNEATKDAFGRTERSSHKANLTGKNTLGALVCKNDELWPGQTFNIGTGFTEDQRRSWWHLPGLLIGKTAKFRYQKIGTQDKPRIPSFLGFRDPIDL